ncbi:hypothetical protein LPUS_11565 [Lasallia pustulata]|uniref:DUF7918 domain-containing protein n=1 Tax=Lasallia pustulata TaxID=136370 RepID=A0A1W5DC37_9LECA|nr:hypothetical protein LPUS_11565 [Lasallia pustulata]
MFVYMDGDYQCNRNRRNLKIPDGNTPRKDTEINFNVRQKENLLEDGTFAAREWRFEKLNVSEDSQQLGHKAPHGAEYVGMIEVVVLRCHPVSAQPDAGNVPVPQPRSSKAPTEPMPVGKLLKVATSLPLSDDSSVSSETSGPFIGTFDGANDEAPREGTVMPFGGDAGWDKPMPQKSKGTQQTQASLASPAASASKPLNEGSGSAAGALIHPQWHGRNQSQSHFRQDWGQSRRPSSQISQSRSSPQMQAQSKSDGVIGNEAATGSVSGSKQSALGNNGEPVRSGTTGQGTPSVIININQVESPPGLWGARTLSPAVSEVDSWATRKSTHDNWKEGCQASQEPRDSRRPDTSWQAQVTWSDIDRGGQPSDDKKEFAKGSLNNKSLANAPTRGDANNVGNKGSKDALRSKADTDTAGGEWPTTTNAATSGYSGIWESKKRNSWDSISPTGGMPGAWSSNEDEKANTGPSPTAVGFEQQVPIPSGRGNEGSGTAQKNSNEAQGQAVVNTSERSGGGKEETVPSGLVIDGNPNAQSWSWGEPKKVNTGSNKPEDKAYPSAFEVKVSQGSVTPVSQLPSGGEKVESTKGDLPSNKGQGRPSFLDKIRPRLSASPPQGATTSAEHERSLSKMPATRTSPGSGPSATGNLISPILPAQPPHRVQASPGKQRSQQASALATKLSPLTAAEVYRKPYWSTNSKSSARSRGTAGDGHSDAYLGPEEPLYTIPEEVVQRKCMSHQVHQGKPVLYAHKTAKPKYMDSHESPYAVFVFNYRSEDAIKEMLSIEVAEDEAEEKKRLHSLSKAELIEHYMRAKAKESNSQTGTAEDWYSVASPETVAGGASVTSPNGVKGPEAWTTKDIKTNTNIGIGIDLNGVTKDFSQLETSPKNASDNDSPKPDKLWGREERNPGCSNTNAGDWNSKSSNNNNNNGGNWTTSNTNGGNHGGGSAAQDQKPSGATRNADDSNAGNNWGGHSKKQNEKDEDNKAWKNWGGEFPTSQGQKNEPNASGNGWGGSGGDTKNRSGGGLAGDGGQGNTWGGDGGTKAGGASGGGGDGKVSGGNGNNGGQNGQKGHGNEPQW